MRTGLILEAPVAQDRAIAQEQFDLCALTRHFPEMSKRSQLVYLLRKGRPTIAIHQTEEHSQTSKDKWMRLTLLLPLLLTILTNQPRL